MRKEGRHKKWYRSPRDDEDEHVNYLWIWVRFPREKALIYCANEICIYWWNSQFWNNNNIYIYIYIWETLINTNPVVQSYVSPSWTFSDKQSWVEALNYCLILNGFIIVRIIINKIELLSRNRFQVTYKFIITLLSCKLFIFVTQNNCFTVLNYTDIVTPPIVLTYIALEYHPGVF